MPFASVIQFEGSPDALVVKSPIENFNTTSQLIVDETHEALLVVNGNAADLFGPGSHTLSVSNLPILNRIINLPTDGTTPFPCKVFFINKVHQMNLLWGTQGPIALEDPLYDIFLHVMLHGSMSISVKDSRKFMLKLVGFRDRFDPDSLVQNFRGIISSHVKDCISKIMINGQLSYFMMNANLLEISDVVKERLDAIFDDYGVIVQFFNIESIEVPEKDYAAITDAKNKRSSRIIQGYTWQEERQMMIAEKFASNEGSMGAMGGMVGGAMGGIMMGGTISELARSALSQDRIPTTPPPKDVSSADSPMGSKRSGTGQSIRDLLNTGRAAGPAQPQPGPQPGAVSGVSGVQPFDIGGFEEDLPQPGPDASTRLCPHCSQPIEGNPRFCPNCGHDLQTARVCPHCGQPLQGDPKFCPNCGTSLKAKVCPNCGQPIEGNPKFCSNCGQNLS